MKKMLFVLAICVMCASTFAATEFPGWKCTDLQKLEAAKQGFIAEKKYWNFVIIDALIEFAKKAPTSFADIENVIDSIKRPEFINETNFNRYKLCGKKGLPYCRHEFLTEAWEFCKKNPSNYDFYYVAYCSKDLNLTDEFIYDFMIEFIDKNQNHPNVSKASKIALDKSVDIDAVKVKADLQKLNRIFSRKLLQDKAKWEPVVAEIRTVLETY